ncbi:MAG: M16 family metallopeptidase [Bacteroidia bacterium]
MKKASLLTFVFAWLTSFCVSAQNANNANTTVLLEKVVAKPGELKIGYEKYLLPNGLTLFIHEDHSDPIVHVEVTYHVGSAREALGKSGFAHFFEHMMFQGSVNVKDEEHFKIVQGAGGQMNGTTNRDRTNYFQTLPSNYLETALWLEADRMGFLLDSVTQKKFEVQRATVKNEKGERVDNQPYGKTSEVMDATLYPSGHPYSWPTIGYLEDLDRVDVEDLKNFFMRWYGPNNASLVVAGDVNPQEVVKLVEKYFGPIPRGPEVRPMRVDPVRLPANRYANIGDNVFLPLYYMVFPTVRSYHADEPAIEILGSIFGQGNNSILYKKFIKSEKAVQAVSFNNSSELAGEFGIQVLPIPDGETDVEKMILEAFEEFEKQGVSDEDLARVKGDLEAGYYRAMESVASRATILSQMWYLSHSTPALAKGWNLDTDIQRYQKVTKEDVMRVFKQYIKGKNYVLVNVFPKRANAAVNKEETQVAQTSGTAVKGELEYKGLSYKRPVDNFDRSKRPVVPPAKPVVAPGFYSENWSNGIKVVGTEFKESPIVTLLLTMKGGNIAVGDPSKTGLSNLTADMMEEATQNYTSEAFEAALSKLGSSISVSSGTDVHSVQVICLKKNLDETLKLFEEKLLRPKFIQEDFKRIQSLNYQQVNSVKYDAGATADLAFYKLIYGKSILAEPNSGTLKSIKAITLRDVQNFYDRFYAPDFATLTIVGDVSKDEILPKLSFLKNWGKKNVVLPNVVASPTKGSNKQIFLVDKYKAAQSEIRMGNLSLPYDWNDKYLKATAANFPFGGNFNSRLNLNLREDKGLTYGIRSNFVGFNNRPGYYLISAGVRTSGTDTAMREIANELNNYIKDGITSDELDFMKKSIVQSDALRYETTFQKAGFLNRIAQFNLPGDYIKQQNQIINGLTKAEIDAITKETIVPENMTILIVGDKDKIKVPLEKMGYKIIDYKEVEVATPAYQKN